MKIEIWSDFVCPFCYMGKKRFEIALEKFEHKDKVEVIYRSYELNPNIATEGNLNHANSLINKYGMNMEEVNNMLSDIVIQGEELGLKYNFDDAISTNTMDAHRLVHYSKTINKSSLLIEKLYKAHFTEGLNIGNHEVLKKLTYDLDFNHDEVIKILNTDQYKENVLEDELRSRLVGAKGVPFFVINEEYWISGAQPSDDFLQSLNEVWEEKKIERNSSGNQCTDDSCVISNIKEQ